MAQFVWRFDLSENDLQELQYQARTQENLAVVIATDSPIKHILPLSVVIQSVLARSSLSNVLFKLVIPSEYSDIILSVFNKSLQSRIEVVHSSCFM